MSTPALPEKRCRNKDHIKLHAADICHTVYEQHVERLKDLPLTSDPTREWCPFCCYERGFRDGVKRGQQWRIYR